MTDYAVRLALALLLIASGIVLYRALVRLRLARLDQAQVLPGLEGFRRGAPAILYFTTPTCAPCRTVQWPAIQQLSAHFGAGLQVFRVDASERADLADYWGVLSVPTTFILDAQGRPRGVNHGVASAEKLRQQLDALAAPAAKQ